MIKKEEIFNLIGKNFKKIRKEIIHKSQEELAKDIGKSRSLIAQIEGNNIKVGVSIDTLFIIARKYNFDIRLFFLGYEDLFL